MRNFRRIFDISIVLIYFSFIYSRNEPLVRRRVLAADADDPDSVAPPLKPVTSESDLLQEGNFSPQDKRKHLDHAREGLRRLLKLKDEPSDAITTSNTKLYIPRAMLEEYLQGRDEVKQFIPNDQDFLGKIDIDGMDNIDENFWTQVFQQSGSYNLEIDMKPPGKDLGDANGSKIKRGAGHSIVIRLQSDPEEVPKNIEPQLPPHVTSTRNQKQYMSVHLKFNLSQSVYSQLDTVEELSQAQLHLTFDKISTALLSDTEQKLMAEQSTICQNSTTGKCPNLSPVLPRYQRLFVLLVTGYDHFNEPSTTIFSNQRVDTWKTSPIALDVSLAVSRWIKDPSTNYGIIIRVRNEDDLYEEQKLVDTRPTGHESKSEGDTPVDLFSITVLEQIRLKRGFGQRSDDDETWIRKQPYIVAYHQPPERHVKRHVGEDETESMQSDDPTVSTEYQQTSTSATNNRETPTDKPSSATVQSSTFDSVSKREHTPTTLGTRRGQSSRATSNGRASSSHQGGASQRPKNKPNPKRQPDKCSKKSLKIDFDEVGWSSWIIAPHSFYANYCSGECTWPLSDTQNATNHAIIQAIYHSVGRVVPKSCCAPVKLARMAILYQLDGVVQMRQYDDMIIEACGCL